MNKKHLPFWISLFAMILFSFTGCSKNAAATDPKITEATAVIETTEPEISISYPQVESLKENVIPYNRFHNAAAFDGRLLKSRVCAVDKENRLREYEILMLDDKGIELCKYRVSSDDACHVSTLTATQDGGFLFVLGFSDYAYSLDAWASDNGFASRVVKCDSKGDLQFDVSLEGVEGSALVFCIEKDEKYYFFGTYQTPETDKRGIYSPSDIVMMELSADGELLNRQHIGGSDYDTLTFAELTGDVFTLSSYSQSSDGDFEGSGSKGYPLDWVITVDADFTTVEMRKETGKNSLVERIGEKNGVPVYSTDPILTDFDMGRPQVYMDYGDLYLIVSERNTGVYENQPSFINSIWYYTETVYSVYNQSGELVFRDAVDSSPDYDKLVESMLKQEQSDT